MTVSDMPVLRFLPKGQELVVSQLPRLGHSMECLRLASMVPQLPKELQRMVGRLAVRPPNTAIPTPRTEPET